VNRCIQITSEQVPDPPGLPEMLGLDNRELNPIGEDIIRHEEGLLVDPGSLGLGVTSFVSTVVGLGGCGRDVVVLLGSHDLAEKSDLLNRSLNREPLMCVKQRHLQIGYVIVLLATSVA